MGHRPQAAKGCLLQAAGQRETVRWGKTVEWMGQAAAGFGAGRRAGGQPGAHLHGKAVADVLHGQVLPDRLELVAGCSGVGWIGPGSEGSRLGCGAAMAGTRAGAVAARLWAGYE